MRNKHFLQRNTASEMYDDNTSATQRINGREYIEKMQARYKQFIQSETTPKTEKFSVISPIPKTEEPTAQEPASSSSYLRQLPHLILKAQLLFKRTPVVVLVVVVGLVTLFIHGYRLSAVPDVFSDEATYLLVGTNVARGIGLVVDHRPFFYHPPAFFLIEAAYIKLVGLTNTDVITALFSVRYLNIFFAATTASLLLLFGRKLHSHKAGLIMVGLFLMDPYVQRINRRNMLETFAMLCLLLGFYIFFTHQKHLTNRQWLGSGIAFGLATLTKEPMFLPLFAFLGIVLWTRRSQLTDAVRVIAIACLLYLFYPLGEIAVGNGPNYLAFKLNQLGSLVSSITGHSLAATSQKTLSPENTQNLLGQYASSYLLIALAGISTIILFLRFRHLMEARYLFAWSIFSFGYVILLGRLSDQYFYFLVVPNAVIVNGYVLAKLFESAQYRRWLGIVLSFFLCLLFLYNSALWVTKYIYSSDNGYAKITTYIKTHIPPGTTIDISDDVGYYLLSPTYNIRLDRDKQYIIDQHEHYFIMSLKDKWGGYNGTTPGFYNWVIQNSQPLVVEQEDSFWTIGLYYMKPSQTTSTSIPSSSSSAMMSQSYSGTLFDVLTGLKTNMSLTDVRQKQSTITGYLGGMPDDMHLTDILENGSFTGTISQTKQVQFTVIGSIKQVFSFEGTIRLDGSIAGTFCHVIPATQKCTNYGLWSVTPIALVQSTPRSIIIPKEHLHHE